MKYTFRATLNDPLLIDALRVELFNTTRATITLTDQQPPQLIINAADAVALRAALATLTRFLLVYEKASKVHHEQGTRKQH